MNPLKYIRIRYIAPALLFIGTVLACWLYWFKNYYLGSITQPDLAKAKEAQPFITGVIVPFLTLGSALLVYENLRNAYRQNFSTNFFKLIELHHKLRDNISEEIWQLSTREKPSKGMTFFDDLCERISFDYQNLNNPSTEAYTTTLPYTLDDYCYTDRYNRTPNVSIQVRNSTGAEKLRIIYDYYFHVHQSCLGHYFRNLYYLVKYADESIFRFEFKANHVRILRAQLSNYELLLLAYNGLHDYGEAFYKLIEKYELLKSLNNESRMPQDHEKRITDYEVLKSEYPHLQRLSSLQYPQNYAANFSVKRGIWGYWIELYARVVKLNK